MFQLAVDDNYNEKPTPKLVLARESLWVLD